MFTSKYLNFRHTFNFEIENVVAFLEFYWNQIRGSGSGTGSVASVTDPDKEIRGNHAYLSRRIRNRILDTDLKCCDSRNGLLLPENSRSS